jgi:hypothetical protein
VVVESPRDRELLRQGGVDEDRIKLIYPGAGVRPYRPASGPFRILFATSPLGRHGRVTTASRCTLSLLSKGEWAFLYVMENFSALRKVAPLAGVNCGSPCHRRAPSMMCNRFNLPHLDSPPRGRHSTVLRFVASGAD